MPTIYNSESELSANTQRLYLAVVDDSGVEKPQFGKIELRLSDVRTVLAAAGTVTPVDSGSPAGEIRLREVQFCQPDGSTVYAIIPIGGLYTKS